VNIGAVMDELAAALNAIPTLRAFGYLPERIVPPAVIVELPELTYDSTMARGADRMVLPVTVLVSRVDSRTARDRLLDLQVQVKAVIDDHEPTAYHSARVTGVEFNPSFPLAGVEYSAAVFAIDIIGPGGQ
jgi:hypothetical protein